MEKKLSDTLMMNEEEKRNTEQLKETVSLICLLRNLDRFNVI